MREIMKFGITSAEKLVNHMLFVRKWVWCHMHCCYNAQSGN